MGSRIHHLKSVSTPQQLFAQQVFCELQPFLAKTYSFTSPTSSSKPSPAAQANPKQQNSL
jgi:hypothetical protein